MKVNQPVQLRTAHDVIRNLQLIWSNVREEQLSIMKNNNLEKSKIPLINKYKKNQLNVGKRIFKNKY